MSAILVTHVLGASLALLAGCLVAFTPKGTLAHRQIGRVCAVSLILMGLSAAPLAADAGKWLDVCSGAMACYLVASAWATLHRTHAATEISLLCVALASICGYLAVEGYALTSEVRRPDAPPGAGLVFASILVLAVTGDVLRLAGRRSSGSARIRRHVWRMCFALFLATGSFFGGRAHLFPEFVRESGALIALASAPLALMIVGLVRPLGRSAAEKTERSTRDHLLA